MNNRFTNKWLGCKWIFVWCLTPFLPLSNALAQVVDTNNMYASASPSVAPGFLKRISDEVGGDSDRWVKRFCEITLSQKGDDYSRLVRVVRRDTTRTTFEERMQLPPDSWSFLGYLNGRNARVAFECLEHGADGAPADVLYDIYLLHTKAPINHYNAKPAEWLRKAAYAGSPDGQVDFAREITRYLYYPSTVVPKEFIGEVTGARYHFWLKSAADGNLPRGMFELARLHTEYFSPKWAESYLDVDFAIQLLKRVAEQDRDLLYKSLAAGDLGALYFNGKLLPINYREALKWFEAVDERFIHHCRAPLSWVRSRLVGIYDEGLGVERNPAKVEYHMQYAGVGC